MDDRVLEIVFYLMDYLHEDQSQASSISDVSVDLKGLGYSDEEITRAYSWILDNLQGGAERLFCGFPVETDSVRILTDIERYRFTPDACTVLAKLAGLRLITGEQFESILERAAVFGRQPVNAEQLRLIVSLVAFPEHSEVDRQTLLNDEADPSIRIN